MNFGVMIVNLMIEKLFTVKTQNTQRKDILIGKKTKRKFTTETHGKSTEVKDKGK